MIEPRDLPLLAVFAAVARRASFTAAAAELELSKSVVSDHVRTLEERCGVRLPERSTRRLTLTQVGEEVLAAVSPLGTAARDVEAILEEHRDAPVGTLRVATTQDLAPRLVAPVAARLAVRHPRLRVEVHGDDALHDLVAEGFDLAVRLGAPRDSGYVMRRLGVVTDFIVASPAVAEVYARAARPRDLAGAPWARHALLSRGETFTFHGPRGQSEEVTVSVRAQANTGDAVRAMVLAGVGAAVLPEHLVADDLGRGALVRLCPEWRWRELSVHAVQPSAKRQPRRVSLFLDALREALAASGGMAGAAARAG